MNNIERTEASTTSETGDTSDVSQSGYMVYCLTPLFWSGGLGLGFWVKRKGQAWALGLEKLSLGDGLANAGAFRTHTVVLNEVCLGVRGKIMVRFSNGRLGFGWLWFAQGGV